MFKLFCGKSKSFFMPTFTWATERRLEIGDMFAKMFSGHGHFCASHPIEVLLTALTVVIGTMSGMGNGPRTCAGGPCMKCEESVGINMPVMTIIRCLAILHIYHKFRSISKLGSKYVLWIAGIFTVFSSFIFSTGVINFLQTDLTELTQALPFFLILIDLSRAGMLAQYALSSTSRREVRENISRGMGALGPAITLDTLVIVIGVGTLSGVRRLDLMCRFACMSVIVNYIVFMTFLPSCLALALDMKFSRRTQEYEARPVWQIPNLTKVVNNLEQKPNPVLQRIKLIMSAGFLLVQAHSRWPIMLLFNGASAMANEDPASKLEFSPMWLFDIYQWIAFNLDKLPVLIFALPLALKYVILDEEYGDNEDYRNGSRNSDNNNTNTLSMAPDLYRSCPLVPTENSDCSPIPCDQGTKDLPDLTINTPSANFNNNQESPRNVEECVKLLNAKDGALQLSDAEIISLVQRKHIPAYRLEWVLADPARGVSIRRRIISELSGKRDALTSLPYLGYDYKRVMGACCENVVGYLPVPVGVAGPLLVNGKQYYVPMATTEGCLVASTNRGCRTLQLSGGVRADLVSEGMTRGPVVKFPSAHRAVCAMQWISEPENFYKLKEKFDSTSRFARLTQASGAVAGDLFFIRFKANTGDAMGMNMVSKGVEQALGHLQKEFPDMKVISVSGNYCIDKKPGALNWIEGRGKYITCEAKIPGRVVRDVLKTTSKALVEVNTSKNLIGSAMAGSIGGFNAQAANIVTAIYIATGQDPAQNVCSSNCMTIVSLDDTNSEDVKISCTMPSLELGTVGGGTVLPPQSACLDLLGCRGACHEQPGKNAGTLARIVCATVLAGELSLLSALAAGHLVGSHMQHNRSQINAQQQPSNQKS